MDLTTMTRARAERLVAQTDDKETLRQLAKHSNKHVGMKVLFKLLKTPEARAHATAVKYLEANLRTLCGVEITS